MNISVKWLRGFINQGPRRFLRELGPNRACICFGVQEGKVALLQKCKKLKKKKKIGLNMNLTRSVVNGVSEEKAKEIELSSLRRSIGKDVKTSFTL